MKVLEDIDFSLKEDFGEIESPTKLTFFFRIFSYSVS